MTHFDALDAWLERHPITPDQATDVVLAHLLAGLIREMANARRRGRRT